RSANLGGELEGINVTISGELVGLGGESGEKGREVPSGDVRHAREKVALSWVILASREADWLRQGRTRTGRSYPWVPR
ncbi:unnamed protein product, partial [Ilex paraguariensis]